MIVVIIFSLVLFHVSALDTQSFLKNMDETIWNQLSYPDSLKVNRLFLDYKSYIDVFDKFLQQFQFRDPNSLSLARELYNQRGASFVKQKFNLHTVRWSLQLTKVQFLVLQKCMSTIQLMWRYFMMECLRDLSFANVWYKNKYDNNVQGKMLYHTSISDQVSLLNKIYDSSY